MLSYGLFLSKDKDLIKKLSGPVLSIIKELLLGKSIEMFSNAGILIENHQLLES